MTMRLGLGILIGLCGSWTAAVPSQAEEPEVARLDLISRTSLFFYVGQFSSTRLNQIIRLDTNFESSWIGILGVTQPLFNLGPDAHFEGEVNVAQHWGQQKHQELNTGLVLRWKWFPWDELFDTSFAFGAGFSYAFERPPIEERPERNADRFLKYLHVELEGARPGWESWSGFVRIHHRSGVFGLLSDARGSNFVGLGLRRRL